jgi:trimeric autotransporter adhesin
MKKTALVLISIIALIFIFAGFGWAKELQSATETYFGTGAGEDYTSGTLYNTFVGVNAGYHNSAGIHNTAIGVNAGVNNTASDNTFLGFESGYNNYEGHQNTYVGSDAGYTNIGGASNTYIGYKAGYYNTGGSNVFIGNNAGAGTGSYSTSNKLYIANSNTTTPLIYGEFDTSKIIINGDLEVSGLIDATLGGVKFPDGNTQLTALTGISSLSLTSFGFGSGSSGASGNVFIGLIAGQQSNASSQDNTCVGAAACSMVQGGTGNSFFGRRAGLNNYGNFNTFIGMESGRDNSSGSGNVFIGYGAGYNEIFSNKLYIANSTTASPLIWGDFANSIVKINGQFYIASDGRYKKNIAPLQTALDKVMGLKGVSYEWKEKNGVGKGRDIGFIAQDVESVIPELVHTDDRGYKSVAYDKITPVLVEAIKEQQKTIAEQKKTLAEKSIAVDEQKQKLDLLEQAVARLVAEVNKLKSKDMSAQK